MMIRMRPKEMLDRVKGGRGMDDVNVDMDVNMGMDSLRYL